MNIFDDSTAQFRRGSALDGPDASAVGGEECVGRSHSFARPFYAAPTVSMDVGTLVPTEAPEGISSSFPSSSSSPLRRDFPTTPYYGILARCEVHMDVAVDGAFASVPRCHNPPWTARQLGRLQRHLNTVAEEHGSVYHLGTGAGPGELAVSPSSLPSSSRSALTYTAYVEAMQDGLRQMLDLRSSCAPSPDAPASTLSNATAHCFYMRILGHPAWRDMIALLCVEEARLLLCVLASSRVSQKTLTRMCEEVGVQLEWVSGATLVVEPTVMAGAEVNPVCALWDAIAHLPLISPAPAVGDTAVDGSGGGSVGASTKSESLRTATSWPAGVRVAMETLQRSSALLRGFHVSLASSRPFRGARRCSPVGRFTEEAVQLSESVAPATASATPTARINGTGARRPVARRYVWRLLPYSSWVLPHFLTKLVQCLVEECEVQAFTLRCGAAAAAASATDLATSAGASGDVSDRRRSTAPGVRLVQADVPSSLALLRGVGTVSWEALSRLSCKAWVDAATREAVAHGVAHGGGGAGDDTHDAAEEAEMEFELNSVQYERCRSAAVRAVPAKRLRGVPVPAACAGTVDTRAWGRCFAFGVSVKRLIDEADARE